MQKYRYTVITCNFGGYEIMREIDNPLSDVEYLYITDDKSITSKTWTIIYDMSYNEYTEPFDKVVVFRSRVLEYCNSPICVRIDGSISINGNSFDETINEMNKNNNDISFIISPRFSTYNSELFSWETQRSIDKKHLSEFINYCALKGFDYVNNKNNICTLTILLQRNNEINRLLNSKQIEVLNEIKQYNNSNRYYRVDQIVFTYVLNEFFEEISVLPLHYTIISNELTKIYFHNTHTLLYDFSITTEKRLYLFDKVVDSLFDGFSYYSLLTRDMIINTSKKLHVNISQSFYSDKEQYRIISNSYNEWCNRNDVLVCNINEGYYYEVPLYERYLINDYYYSNLLSQISKLLNIDFDENDFNMFEYMSLRQYIPKKIIDNICFVPKLIKESNTEYYQIVYDYNESLLHENSLTLSNLKSVHSNIFNYSSFFNQQFKFSLNSFKIQKDRICKKDDRTLLVITDGTIIPFIHILNHYFYTVIVIDNQFNNIDFEFLYAYEKITDILILTSTNKPLNLIIDNI